MKAVDIRKVPEDKPLLVGDKNRFYPVRPTPEMIQNLPGVGLVAASSR